MAIESKISALLGAKRINISEFAREAKISYPAAHELYHGKSKVISFEMMEKLCKYFEAQPGDLFVYVPDSVSN